jgi:hypothetical protein
MSELNKALAAAQLEMKNPEFDSTNPHFKNKYASLASVRNAVVPVFAKHGIGVVQTPVCSQGYAGVRTVLTHSDGTERDCGELTFRLQKDDAQGAGSAITYARRYALQAIAGVVGDADDDGNEASKTPSKPPVKAGTFVNTNANGTVPGLPTAIDQLGAVIAKASSNEELLTIAAHLGALPEETKTALRPAYKKRTEELAQ